MMNSGGRGAWCSHHIVLANCHSGNSDLPIFLKKVYKFEFFIVKCGDFVKPCIDL